jgi:glutathione S-transferase
VRIVLAEKQVEYETVAIDLDDRPAWIFEKNPLGRVPVLEEDTFVLAESAVIDEYLEERYPEPALWPADPGDRALGRLLVHRFDELSRPYYALRRGEEGAGERFDAALAELDGLLEAQPFLSGREFGLADIAYIPWILRARDRMEVELTPYPALADWVSRLEQRPSVAAELDVVASL